MEEVTAAEAQALAAARAALLALAAVMLELLCVQRRFSSVGIWLWYAESSTPVGGRAFSS